MAEVTATLVKDLRERTGAGMMDCKKALAENDGNIDASIDWLRAKGLSKAAKKADRAAAEGVVAIALAGPKGAVIELNSETDFVARNEQFQAAAREFARLALTAPDHGALLAAQAEGGSVQDKVTALIATIGENITLRRSAVLSVPQGAVVSYIHNQIADGVGRIGVLVALESAAPVAAVEEIGRKVAMHIAAASPVAVSEADVPADIVAHEKTILAAQVREDPKAQGKPDSVIEKMLEGRLRKYFEESVLLKQVFVHAPDGKQTVEAAVAEAGKAAGGPILVRAFVRFAVGEGVEKRTDDFAAEVAAMTRSDD